MTARGYWMDEPGDLLRRAAEAYLGDVLRPAVEAYLHGGEMTSTELMALKAYLKTDDWRAVENLRARIDGLDTREELRGGCATPTP